MSGSDDKVSGLVSLFHVLESIFIIRRDPGQQDDTPTRFRTTAVWMRTEEDDPAADYEFESVFRQSPENIEQIVKSGQFSFGKPIFRFVADNTFKNFPGPGVLTAIHRIRKIEEGSGWISQEFPILLQEMPPGSDTLEPSKEL